MAARVYCAAAALVDCGERPGAMFADWKLIGVPLRVAISDRGLKAGTLGLQSRREATASPVAVADAATEVKRQLTLR